MRIQSLDDQVSLRVDSPQDAQALAEHLRKDATWLEVVAGIDTVAVRFDAASTDARVAERRLGDVLDSEIPPLPVRNEVLEIPVVYGGEYGPDLDALCQQLGMTQCEFVALHTGSDYSVDMVGFTPGFAFIGGLPSQLHIPRREQPRQRVAAGSVAIADGRTGIYALPSPGGWTLIGRTPYPLFDPQAAEPFPVRAGTRIRFVAVAADVFSE
ncbi:MAG: 5-oxoprolinase subunit PxpB [Gammaproteobacteria bacterium]|nr:5-oxoprolinase subunit PxpB [Gammaproteobacteria bacterium]